MSVSTPTYMNTIQRWSAVSSQTAQPAAPQPAPRLTGLIGPAFMPAIVRDRISLQTPIHVPQAIPTSLPALTAAPSSAPAAPSFLTMGSGGAAVTHVQQRLNVWGYNVGRPDGDYGKITFNQVKNFQRNQGLPVDGKVGNQTLTALNRTPAPPPAATTLDALRSGKAQLISGSQGAAVEHVQERLKVWGYNIGRSDGDYGVKTTEAVKQFQQARGIQANGRVGQQTLTALETTPVRATALGGSALGVTTLGANSDSLKLARTAQREAARRDTVGWCYSGVATAVSRALGVELYGKSAWQASPILARSDDFREIRSVRPKDLPKLPAGAIVVWGKTAASPHGHISVALGNGREASDHIDEQRTQLRGHTNFRVFMPA